MTWTHWERVSDFDFEEAIYEKKYHVQLGGGIARFTINRPKRMNTFTPKLTSEMAKAFYNISTDPMIGVAIITGAGRQAFSVGGDVSQEKDAAEATGAKEPLHWTILSVNRLIRLCRKPVIAAVNGYAIGSGNHLAYHCDFTLAADHAIFGQNGPRVSSPIDGGAVSYLYHVVGAKKAREIWMLCRRYTAQEALDMGLVNKVVPYDKLNDEVDRWCEDILRASPACVEILKRTFDTIVDEGLPYQTIAGSMYSNFFETPEGIEGQTAFLEKRPTNFWKIRKDQAKTKRGDGDFDATNDHI